MADEYRPLEANEARFWHGGWKPNRRRVWEAYGRLHLNGKRCEAFRCCGSGTWLERKDDDLRIRANFCHDRNCQVCQGRAVARVRLELARVWKPGKVRFITLTVKHTDVALAQQWKTIRRHFQELRRSKLWKANVDGGAAFCENKIGNDGLYHPHIHIIAEGRWMDQTELRKVWHGITLNSWIVHIKAAEDEAQVIHYVTKYVTKPYDQSIYADPAKLDECIVAMRGVKMMSSFGTWKHLKLRKPVDKADKEQWKPIGRVDAIINQRDEESRRWAEAIKRKWPKLHAAFFRAEVDEHDPP